MTRSQDSFATASLIREIYSRCMNQIGSGMADSGLSHQQIMVIRLIAHNKTIQVSQLCQEMALTKGTVSGILNRMEQAGYIEKYKTPKDKRNTYIRFSPMGQAFADKFRQSIITSYDRIFENFSDEALAKARVSLQQIAEKLVKEENESCTEN